MIKKRTGFVIGAGASKSYNLPTGLELREQIIRSNTNSDYFKGLNIPGYSADRFRQFTVRFENSGIHSIDKFLNLNPNFSNEGKFIISYLLKQQEHNNYKQLNQNNWIQYLFNKMIESISNYDSAYKINHNQIYFATFNYDRLLEYGLSNSYLNSFHNNQLINNLYTKSKFQGLLDEFHFSIDHVYGQIGTLKSNEININDDRLITNYYNDIHLINEREKDVSHIIESLDECERIFFLGYGFNKENDKLLKLNQILKNKEVLGTAFNWFDEEIDRISNIYGCKLYNCDSLDLLRRFL